MRPKRKTYTTTGIKEWIPVDHYAAQYNVAVVLAVGATVTYTVEYTKADILGGDTPAATQVFSEAAQSAQSGNTELIYLGPISAFRINIAAITGNGVEFQILTHKGENK